MFFRYLFNALLVRSCASILDRWNFLPKTFLEAEISKFRNIKSAIKKFKSFSNLFAWHFSHLPSFTIVFSLDFCQNIASANYIARGFVPPSSFKTPRLQVFPSWWVCYGSSNCIKTLRIFVSLGIWLLGNVCCKTSSTDL